MNVGESALVVFYKLFRLLLLWLLLCCVRVIYLPKSRTHTYMEPPAPGALLLKIYIKITKDEHF
jgi:hypothetical protein